MHYIGWKGKGEGYKKLNKGETLKWCRNKIELNTMALTLLRILRDEFFSFFFFL